MQKLAFIKTENVLTSMQTHFVVVEVWYSKQASWYFVQMVDDTLI